MDFSLEGGLFDTPPLWNTRFISDLAACWLRKERSAVSECLDSQTSLRCAIRAEAPLNSSFLPEFYPDELFYSVVARFGHWDRAPTARVNHLLFGTKVLRLAHDIPLQIGALVTNVGAGLSMVAEEIADRHTLLPFYTALREREDYYQFRRDMIAGVQIHQRLTGGKRSTPWPNQLRYCPACDRANRRDYGVPIWLRRHQLITSIICRDHGQILLNSEVETGVGRERRYVPASDIRTESRPVATINTDRAMAQYDEITAFGHRMLASQEKSSAWWPRPNLRQLALQKGFVDPIGRTDVSGLIAEIDHHYAEAMSLWPLLQNFEGRKGLHWLYNLLGGSGHNTNPICRALVETFLIAHGNGVGADPARRQAHKTAAKPPKPDMRPISHAAENDEAIAEKVKAIAMRLREETPPARITQGKILTHIPDLFRMMQSHKLPLTRAALRDAAESRDDLAPRALRWMFEQAALNGERIKLNELLGRRVFKNRELVRREWYTYYGESEPRRIVDPEPDAP